MGIYKFDKSELNDKDIVARRKRHEFGYYAHWHEYYEIMFYKNCKGHCVMNGEKYEIENDCLFFLTPTDYHQIEAEAKGGAYSVNISFTDKIIDNSIIKNFSISPRFTITPSEYICDTIYKIYETYTNEPVSQLKDIELRLMLNYLLVNILSEGQQVKSDNTVISPIIRNAILYILADISAPYTLSDISAKCGITPSHFSYVFHREMGIPFKKWLANSRVELAKHMLEITDSSVLDICLECGFGSLSHFIKVFREIVGVTPNTYRSQKHGI